MMLFECKVTHFQQKDAPFSLKKYVSNVASIRILIINHPNAHAEITVSYIEAIKGNAKYTGPGRAIYETPVIGEV